MNDLAGWKILSVNKFYYVSGGSETYLFALEELLRSRNAEVISFAEKDERNRPSPYSDYFVKERDFFSGNVLEKLINSLSMIYSPHARKKLAELLNDHPAHIAHLHNYYGQMTPSIFYELKERGIPIIYTVHDLKPCCPVYTMLVNGEVCERCRGGKYYHCLLQRCTKGSTLGSLVNTVEGYIHRMARVYDMVDVLIAPSRFYRSKMIEFGFPEEQVMHLDYCIDVDSFTPVYEDKGYFLYMGRLAHEKGLYTLIEAVGKVPGATLHVAGTGPLEKDIKRHIADRGMNNVKMLGFQSGENLSSLVKGAKAIVIPSEWYENSPLTLYESFSTGKPVVASRIGGLPEYVEDGVTGYTFPHKDVDALAAVLEQCLSDGKGMNEMGRNARRRAEKMFHPDYHFEQISELYRRLAAAYDLNVS